MKGLLLYPIGGGFPLGIQLTASFGFSVLHQHLAPVTTAAPLGRNPWPSPCVYAAPPTWLSVTDPSVSAPKCCACEIESALESPVRDLQVSSHSI